MIRRHRTSLGSYIMIILAIVAIAFMAGRDAGLGPFARLFEQPAAPDTVAAPTTEAPAATRPGAGGGIVELIQPGEAAINIIISDGAPPVINDIIPDAAPAAAPPAYNAAQAIYDNFSPEQAAEFHAPPATPTAVPTLAPQVLPTVPAGSGYCGGRSRCAPNPAATPGVGR